MFKKLLFIMALAAGFSLANLAQAAIAPTADINVPTTVSIPLDMAAAWKGLYTLPSTSVLLNQPPTVKELFQQYIGQDKPEQTSYRTYFYNPLAISGWVSRQAADIDQKPQEPALQIDNDRATSFTPPQDGRTLNVYQTTLNVIGALEQGQFTADLVVNTTAPRTSLGELDNLGINELISRGQSNYGNSPSNRIHNIKVGVSKMAGVIIAPGDEFSFNKYLGPVEKAQGFLPELVIKAEGTVPELGGGLCQVSTTTFRAAMGAGLPITDRRNHSYAVSYYAPQGTDATIYPGSADLKFVNDTGGSIMIWPYVDEAKHNVFFDFYGTKDGRKVTLQTPVQYDRKSDGSMKAYWTRVVVKGGVTETKTFDSTYQPPALFHKTEQFVPNPTSPPPGTQNPTPGSTPATPSVPTNTAPNNTAPTNVSPTNS